MIKYVVKSLDHEIWPPATYTQTRFLCGRMDETKWYDGRDWHQCAVDFYTFFIREHRERDSGNIRHGKTSNARQEERTTLLHLSANLTQLKRLLTPPPSPLVSPELHSILPTRMYCRAAKQIALQQPTRSNRAQDARVSVPKANYPLSLIVSVVDSLMFYSNRIKWEKDTASAEIEL